MTLKQIKSKRASVLKTKKVTKSMEAVSAVKMRKSQERALHGRPYAHAALSILKNVSESFSSFKHPLLEQREIKNIGFLVITSDRGLAGSLNSGIFKKINEKIEEKGYKKEQVKIIAIGKKGFEYFSKRGYSVLNHHEALDDGIDVATADVITKEVVSYFMDETIDRCHLAYSDFRSTFEQYPRVRRLLPLSAGAIDDMIHSITPKAGKYAGGHLDVDEVKARRYSIEPSADEVLNEMLPLLVNVQIFHSVLESKASEHSARMVAMKNASDKAGDVIKELTLAFNKGRQAMITAEVSEIISGVESINN